MKEVYERLEQFDKKYGWDSYNRISSDDERIRAAEKEVVNLLGEFGELANDLKKSRRDGVYYGDKLKEEAADMFIFFLKLTKVLDMDLEKEYYKKLDINEERFKHLEK